MSPPTSFRYQTKLVSPQKGWLFLFLPNHLLGTKDRVWLKGTLNGQPFQATANPWRQNQHVVTINRQMRQELGIAGEAEVTLEAIIVFTPPPPSPLAPDFAAALKANPQAKAVFDRLSPSHRKKYISHIDEVKRPQTRAARIASMVTRLIESAS